MKNLLCFLVLFGVLAQAAAAEELTGYMLQPLDTLQTQKAEFNDITTLSYDATEDGNAIMLIHFKVPNGHTANYQIYYYGGVLSGSASVYTNISIIPPTTATSVITLEGVTKQYDYIDLNPEYDYYLSGYAKNITTGEQGIIVYNAGYGSFDNDLAIFYKTGNLASNLIYRFDITCDEAFDIDITYAGTEAVAAAADKNWLEIAYEWMALGVSIAGALYDVVILFFTWLIFIKDNWVLIVALFITVSAAFYFNTSKNIFVAIKRYFNSMRGLFEFFIGLWRWLIGIIAEFRSIFRL